MNYEGIIIRPPSEADSLILQITVGCSHNKCTFCPAYKEKRFRIKGIDEIFKDIDKIALRRSNDVRRVFLCDGDALIIDQTKLLTILDHLGRKFHRLQRVGIYGNAKSILRKSVEELAELKDRKLGIVYLGLESGDIVTLERVKKGVGPEQMVEAGRRVKDAGIKLNVTVILGIAGKSRSSIHAVETMRILNLMKPNHVAALTLMIAPGTPICDEFENGEFCIPDKFELLEELKTMLNESKLENCLFFSNHASNYFPINVRLPRDKDKVLEELDHVISSRDERSLRDEFMRGL